MFQRLRRIFDPANVAINNHRYRDRLLDAGDKAPVCLVPVHLVAGAAVDRHHFCAQILGNPGQLGGVERGVVPAHPHFDRDRYVDRLDRRLDQRGGQREIAHQRRSGIAVDNLLDRTTHVDVDNRGAAVGIKLGRLGHFRWRAAGELERNRLFHRIPRRFLQRLTRFADHRRAGDHLGHIQTRAIAPHQLAERHIGHARHRSEDHRAVDLHWADVDRNQLRRDRKRVHCQCLKFGQRIVDCPFDGKRLPARLV